MTLDFEQDMVEALENENMQFILVVADKNTKDYRLRYGIYNDDFFNKAIKLLKTTAESFETNDDE